MIINFQILSNVCMLDTTDCLLYINNDEIIKKFLGTDCLKTINFFLYLVKSQS